MVKSANENINNTKRFIKIYYLKLKKKTKTNNQDMKPRWWLVVYTHGHIGFILILNEKIKIKISLRNTHITFLFLFTKEMIEINYEIRNIRKRSSKSTIQAISWKFTHDLNQWKIQSVPHKIYWCFRKNFQFFKFGNSKNDQIIAGHV